MTDTTLVVVPKSSGTIRDDLRQGLGYVLARRAKLIVYVGAAASFLVVNGLVHGQAEAIANAVIAVVGFLTLHQVPMAPPAADVVTARTTPVTHAEDRPLPTPPYEPEHAAGD